MNLQIIGVHFRPCCADMFPPCVPSHFLRVIAFKRKVRKVNNQRRAPVVSEWTTNTELIFF